MRFKAAFFDAGNTLLGLDYGAVANALKQEGFHVTRDDVWRAECQARVKLDPFLAQVEVRESLEVFARYMRYTCEAMGIPWEEKAGRALEILKEINRKRNLWRGCALPGAREVLAELKAAGYLVGVVSNADGRLTTLLEEEDLTEHLNVIMDSRLVGFEKPDPRIFHLAMEQIGVVPEEAVHVGDFYSLDVVGARSAGLHAILLDPVGAWPPLDCVKAKDLFEVRDLLLDSR
ncbi:MAG: HAD family hydrolase [Candidatus Methylomirabilales bacterium]